MNLAVLDPERAIAVAASEAEVALADGDTVRAKQQFQSAGDLLRSAADAAFDSVERNRTRFLAASQYYHGGEYRAAYDLCGRIQNTLLDDNSRRLCDQLRKESRLRSRPEYETGVLNRLQKLRLEGRCSEVLQLLRDHPYVLSRDHMAYVRADCCEALRDYRTAALFLSDSVRFGIVAYNPFELAAGAVMSLIQTDLDAAWEFVSHLLELLPHPLISLSASLVCYYRTWGMPEEESRALLDRQLELFVRAEVELPNADPATLSDDDVRSQMAIAYQSAALTYARLGDLDRARHVVDVAVSLGPDNPHARNVRTLVYGADPIAVSTGKDELRAQLDSLRKSPAEQRGPVPMPA